MPESNRDEILREIAESAYDMMVKDEQLKERVLSILQKSLRETLGENPQLLRRDSREVPTDSNEIRQSTLSDSLYEVSSGSRSQEVEVEDPLSVAKPAPIESPVIRSLEELRAWLQKWGSTGSSRAHDAAVRLSTAKKTKYRRANLDDIAELVQDFLEEDLDGGDAGYSFEQRQSDLDLLLESFELGVKRFPPGHNVAAIRNDARDIVFLDDESADLPGIVLSSRPLVATKRGEPIRNGAVLRSPASTTIEKLIAEYWGLRLRLKGRKSEVLDAVGFDLEKYHLALDALDRQGLADVARAKRDVVDFDPAASFDVIWLLLMRLASCLPVRDERLERRLLRYSRFDRSLSSWPDSQDSLELFRRGEVDWRRLKDRISELPGNVAAVVVKEDPSATTESVKSAHFGLLDRDANWRTDFPPRLELVLPVGGLFEWAISGLRSYLGRHRLGFSSTLSNHASSQAIPDEELCALATDLARVVVKGELPLATICSRTLKAVIFEAERRGVKLSPTIAPTENGTVRLEELLGCVKSHDVEILFSDMARSVWHESIQRPPIGEAWICKYRMVGEDSRSSSASSRQPIAVASTKMTSTPVIKAIHEFACALRKQERRARAAEPLVSPSFLRAIRYHSTKVATGEWAENMGQLKFWYRLLNEVDAVSSACEESLDNLYRSAIHEILGVLESEPYRVSEYEVRLGQVASGIPHEYVAHFESVRSTGFPAGSVAGVRCRTLLGPDGRVVQKGVYLRSEEETNDARAT